MNQGTKTMIKALFASILISLMYSCVKPINKAFRTPIIIQATTNDSIIFIEEESITSSWRTRFKGKAVFCDTLIIPVNMEDTTGSFGYFDNYQNDFFYEGKRAVLNIHKTDSLEIAADYESSVAMKHPDNNIAYYYYPVYVVNNTSQTRVFTGKDGHVFAIQEALDSNGDWRPIEIRPFYMCGNGAWSLKIHSQEFLTFFVPKYKGDYETKLRIRLKVGDKRIGETIYFSESFEGTINTKQFYFYNLHGDLFPERLSNKEELFYYFYAAEPLETDEILKQVSRETMKK